MGYSIEVNGLLKKFGAFTAVDRISFSVNEGEVFGFLGPNGAGKTTTIRMLCGLIDPTGGEGRVGGLKIGPQSEAIKQIIGYMSQKFSLYDDLTVSQNIDFYSGLYQTKRETRKAKKEEILKTADLVGMENLMAGTLAGSTKQHLALSCAMIHEPRIIFLDEPTAGVDPLSRRQFWEAIKEMAAKGITVLVTTHYMDEAERCNRVALINTGRIIAIDSPENLKQKMEGALLEIACDQVMLALDILRKTDFIRDVALYGIYLHALVDEEALQEKVLALLEKNQIKVDRIQKVLPSLEDVFVFLIEKGNRQNVQAAAAHN